MNPATMKPVCGYCRREAALVTGDVIHPGREDLQAEYFWRCAPSDAWVSCHPPAGPGGGGGVGDGTVPMGSLANAELRRWRSSAHALFDPIWQSGKLSRHQAYGWLAKTLRIPREQCHIGMFNLEQCKATARAAAARDD